MQTTAVFAEILVEGLVACVWLLLLVGYLFGTEWLDAEILVRWKGGVAVFAIAVAYTLGILVDRTADSLGFLLGLLWGKITDKWRHEREASRGKRVMIIAKWRTAAARIGSAFNGRLSDTYKQLGPRTVRGEKPVRALETGDRA